MLVNPLFRKEKGKIYDEVQEKFKDNKININLDVDISD